MENTIYRKIILATIYLISFTFLYSMDESSSCSHTKLSHLKIIENAAPPPFLLKKLDALFKGNQELVDAFVQRENTMTNAQRRALAKKYKMIKLAGWNYVFRTSLLPGFILKFGPIHWTNSFGGVAIRCKEVINKNVSRVAYQQLIRGVIKKNHLKHVRVVKKYLYRVSKNKTLCDENYIVVAEDIENNLINYEKNLEKLRVLSEQDQEELCIIARQAYFADIKPEDCSFGKDGIIYLIDTEQTCKAKETDFFLNNEEQMAIDSDIGVRRVDLFKKLKETDWFARHIRKKASSSQYCEMGIEPNDKATVTQETIDRDQEDAGIYWFGYY